MKTHTMHKYKVLFFSSFSTLLITSLKVNKNTIRGYVVNGAWYLDYDIKNKIVNCYDGYSNPFEKNDLDDEWKPKSIPVISHNNIEYPKIITVDFKKCDPYNYYNEIINLAQKIFDSEKI